MCQSYYSNAILLIYIFPFIVDGSKNNLCLSFRVVCAIMIIPAIFPFRIFVSETDVTKLISEVCRRFHSI